MHTAVAVPQPGAPSAGRARPKAGPAAEHEQRRQRHLQRQRAELQRHDDLRPRHRGVEAAEGGEQQRRRQRHGQRREVATHLHRHLGLRAREVEEGLREQQQQAAGHRQGERQPHRLVQLCAAGLEVLRAVELAGDRADRQHDAHQPDEHRDVGRAADGQRREVGAAGARRHHGVDGGEGQHRHLADEHRPGQRGDASCAVRQAARAAHLVASPDRSA